MNRLKGLFRFNSFLFKFYKAQFIDFDKFEATIKEMGNKNPKGLSEQIKNESYALPINGKTYIEKEFEFEILLGNRGYLTHDVIKQNIIQSYGESFCLQNENIVKIIYFNRQNRIR